MLANLRLSNDDDKRTASVLPFVEPACSLIPRVHSSEEFTMLDDFCADADCEAARMAMVG